nr:hypothetical protein [Bacillus thuringiensis]
MVSEPIAIKAKKQLHDVGLLDEEPVKDGANRLYVLEPELTTDNWMYKAEIEIYEKRKRQKKKKKEKNEKRKKHLKKQKKGKKKLLNQLVT